jgi:hypothetical protein
VLTGEVGGIEGLSEELYFNKPMDHQMFRFLEEHPHSKIGGEILLYFASQYDFERRALDKI